MSIVADGRRLLVATEAAGKRLGVVVVRRRLRRVLVSAEVVSGRLVEATVRMAIG